MHVPDEDYERAMYNLRKAVEASSKAKINEHVEAAEKALSYE